MQRLAAEHGISGNGLAKICDRLNDPPCNVGDPARGCTGQRASQMQDTDPRGMGDRICPAHRVELLQQRCNVILGRVCRNAEPAGNQLVRRALGQQREHFQLSGLARRGHGISPGCAWTRARECRSIF